MYARGCLVLTPKAGKMEASSNARTPGDSMIRSYQKAGLRLRSYIRRTGRCQIRVHFPEGSSDKGITLDVLNQYFLPIVHQTVYPYSEENNDSVILKVSLEIAELFVKFYLCEIECESADCSAGGAGDALT
jgi:hypothetical protein